MGREVVLLNIKANNSTLWLIKVCILLSTQVSVQVKFHITPFFSPTQIMNFVNILTINRATFNGRKPN